MKYAVIACATLALGAGSLALAADAKNPDAQIKFRKGLMQAVGGTASGIASVLKGEVAAEQSIADMSQALLAVTEPALLGAAFAPNTTGQGTEKTTASDKIWSDWEGYLKKAGDFRAEVEKVAAKGNDVTFDDMKPLFGTCKACHDDYRER